VTECRFAGRKALQTRHSWHSVTNRSVLSKLLVLRATSTWAQGVVGSNPIAPTNLNLIHAGSDSQEFVQKNKISQIEGGHPPPPEGPCARTDPERHPHEAIEPVAYRYLVAAHKLVLLFLIGAYILVHGCRGSETIWSAEVQSPDGKMTATARAFGNSGFGINGVDTSVYLNWTTGSQPPTMILNLADGSDAPTDTGVEMKWLTPTHLELTFTGNRSVGFQALKFAGVDISVRDLSDKSSKPSE